MTPTCSSGVSVRGYAYSGKLQSRTQLEESEGNNEEGDLHYSKYNNPYVSSEEQSRINVEQHTSTGPYPRDVDEDDVDDEESKVDEDPFLEFIIDCESYDA